MGGGGRRRASRLRELRLAGNRGLAVPPLHVTYGGVPAVFEYLRRVADAPQHTPDPHPTGPGRPDPARGSLAGPSARGGGAVNGRSSSGEASVGRPGRDPSPRRTLRAPPWAAAGAAPV
jgi:hypothetical protein